MSFYPLNLENLTFDPGKSILIANAATNPPNSAVPKKARLNSPKAFIDNGNGNIVMTIPTTKAAIAIH